MGEVNNSNLRWYSMRVAYHRELRVRDELERLGVEHYLPLKWGQRNYGGHLRRVQVPALNMIFIRTTKEDITKMKMYNQELSNLRYRMVVSHNVNKPAEAIVVPDREMNSFIKATQNVDERLEYLTYTDFLDKEGKKVKVIDGDFAGIEGEIKRIRKSRCVVVCLRGIAAVALQIPFKDLEFL